MLDGKYKHWRVTIIIITTYISRLVHKTHFWNSLHQVRSKQQQQNNTFKTWNQENQRHKQNWLRSQMLEGGEPWF
jgi:ferric-dicitrate binding protein FerR (iron transport regulator)